MKLPEYRPVKDSNGIQRARRKMKHIVECQLRYAGDCLGILDTVHLDGNQSNNADLNLMKLCRSHHRLLDMRIITLENPQTPPFRIRGGNTRHRGERRYLLPRREERKRYKARRRARDRAAKMAALAAREHAG